MSRRLKAVKDLSVLIIAQRRHDRQLWADLLKNCGINNPLSMSDIKQAATSVGSGQVDVVFVDESYGPQGIANILIPARGVEFAGGRGVCLVLCSKKATAQDVLNARKLGFASLVILPASTDTVRKHLELAARYLRPSDEELGWSAPKQMEERDSLPMPEARDEPDMGGQSGSSSGALPLKAHAGTVSQMDPDDTDMAQWMADEDTAAAQDSPSPAGEDGGSVTADHDAQGETGDQSGKVRPSAQDQEDVASLTRMKAPGRSGQTQREQEEVVFL